ncbi:MAG: hypothetical protein ABI333_20795 [bacterium]
MKNITLAVLCVALGVGTGCDELTRKKRREATIKKLEKTDCKSIVAKVRRCKKAISDAGEKLERASGKKHISVMVELNAHVMSKEDKCLKAVAARIRYLRKDCLKYGSKLAQDTCQEVQRRHVDLLKALNDCFAADDCGKIAACFVKRYGSKAI